MTSTRSEATSHKERMLREGQRQLYAGGLHGMRVDALLAASGVPKGSFYHHFGSKNAFAQAVLSRYARRQTEQLERWAAREELSTTDRLTGYFREKTRAFVGSGFRRACLAGKLSTEVAAASEPFRSQLDHDLHEWKDRMVTLLEDGRRRGDVRADRDCGDLADSLLALIQGAFVIALSTRDERSLEAVAGTIAETIAGPGAHRGTGEGG